MPVKYKIDVMSALKSKGYSSYVLLDKERMGNNYIGQRQIQQIRSGDIVSKACGRGYCFVI